MFMQGILDPKTIVLIYILLSSISFTENRETGLDDDISGWKSTPSIGIFKFSNYWKATAIARDAVDGAADQLQNNLLLVLTELGKDSLKLSRTVKFTIGGLVTAFVDKTFDFSTLIVSTSKIFTEALPVQLVSVLNEMQNDKNVTRELNSTISSVIEFIMEAEQSGISQNLFRPATNIVPNLLVGVNRFLVAILNAVFFLIGAREYSTVSSSTQTPFNISKIQNSTEYNLTTPNISYKTLRI